MIIPVSRSYCIAHTHRLSSYGYDVLIVYDFPIHTNRQKRPNRGVDRCQVNRMLRRAIASRRSSAHTRRASVVRRVSASQPGENKKREASYAYRQPKRGPAEELKLVLLLPSAASSASCSTSRSSSLSAFGRRRVLLGPATGEDRGGCTSLRHTGQVRALRSHC
jgi:hypothetical protein